MRNEHRRRLLVIPVDEVLLADGLSVGRDGVESLLSNGYCQSPMCSTAGVSYSLSDPGRVQADRGGTIVALRLPEGSQERVQGGAVPLVTNAREQARLDGPDVRETILHLACADTSELSAGAVVTTLALDGGTADKCGGRSEEGDEGRDGEEHRFE